MTHYIKVGCCGFPCAKSKYYKEFALAEIQKTFYKLPRIELAYKWRNDAPENFEFTIKASQLITHTPSSPTYRKAKIDISEDKKGSYGSFRNTDEVFRAWEETKKIANALKANLILFQSPASFKPESNNIENIRNFFSKIEREGFKLVWEPRGKWSGNLIKEQCECRIENLECRINI